MSTMSTADPGPHPTNRSTRNAFASGQRSLRGCAALSGLAMLFVPRSVGLGVRSFPSSNGRARRARPSRVTPPESPTHSSSTSRSRRRVITSGFLLRRERPRPASFAIDVRTQTPQRWILACKALLALSDGSGIARARARRGRRQRAKPPHACPPSQATSSASLKVHAISILRACSRRRVRRGHLARRTPAVFGRRVRLDLFSSTPRSSRSKLVCATCGRAVAASRLVRARRRRCCANPLCTDRLAVAEPAGSLYLISGSGETEMETRGASRLPD